MFFRKNRKRHNEWRFAFKWLSSRWKKRLKKRLKKMQLFLSLTLFLSLFLRVCVCACVIGKNVPRLFLIHSIWKILWFPCHGCSWHVMLSVTNYRCISSRWMAVACEYLWVLHDVPFSQTLNKNYVDSRTSYMVHHIWTQSVFNWTSVRAGRFNPSNSTGCIDLNDSQKYDKRRLGPHFVYGDILPVDWHI